MTPQSIYCAALLAFSRETSNGDEQNALPSVTFDEERTIRLGGVNVQLLHFGAARTSGDAVVYFPDLKVVAVGDLYTSTMPVTDDGAGGSLEGWRAALQRILQLDFDTVVPGTGPIVQRAELEAFATRIDKLAVAQHGARLPYGSAGYRRKK